MPGIKPRPPTRSSYTFTLCTASPYTFTPLEFNLMGEAFSKQDLESPQLLLISQIDCSVQEPKNALLLGPVMLGLLTLVGVLRMFWNVRESCWGLNPSATCKASPLTQSDNTQG